MATLDTSIEDGTDETTGNIFEKYVELTEGDEDGLLKTEVTKKKEAPPAAAGGEEEDDPFSSDDDEGSPEAADEGGDGDEGSGDEEEEEGEDGEPAQTYTVKVDGKAQAVTLDELKNGYSRTADYTRKTMELSAQRKETETERAQILAERETLAAAYRQAKEQLDKLDPEPDWESLKDDREEYLYQRALWTDKLEKRQKLDAVQQELVRRNEADRQKQRQSFIASEAEALLDKLPKWKDEKVAKKELAAIREYGKSLGFTDENLDDVIDHRLVLLLRDGARYRRLAETKGKLATVKTGERTAIKESSPRPAKPGTAAKAQKGVKVKRLAAMERLRESGAASDAADVFATIPGLFD